MTAFSNKFTKPYFWPILGHFPNFGDKRFFTAKSASVTQNYSWAPDTMPKFGKNQ